MAGWGYAVSDPAADGSVWEGDWTTNCEFFEEMERDKLAGSTSLVSVKVRFLILHGGVGEDSMFQSTLSASAHISTNGAPPMVRSRHHVRSPRIPKWVYTTPCHALHARLGVMPLGGLAAKSG